MRLFAATATLVAVAWTASAQAQQVQAEELVLDNGMKFLLLPRHDQPNTISAGWLAKVGSVNERPGITGLSHFFEHMMFKGTNTIGTRDPRRDAEYRAKQKEVRDEINRLVWTEQYGRYFDGEIADPWDPANDTPKLAELRKQLKQLMDAEQGKANGDRIAQLKGERAKLDPNAAGSKEKLEAIDREIAQLEADQTSKAAIVKDEFDQVYTKAGGSGMNAFTSFDMTFFFITVPSNKFELWAWMESDRLNDSVFREFYSERDVVHEERRLRTESTPTGVFEEQFDNLFWTSSGYSWPVIGWPSDLNSYTMEDAQRHWDTFYRPNNLVGIVVGDFQPDEVKPVIQEYFGRLKPGKVAPPPVITLEHPTSAEMRMNAAVDAQPSVEIRWHTVPAGHKDAYALDVLADILNGRTGRLYKSMVEGKGIASSVRAGLDARRYAGAFSVTAETKGDATPAQLEAAINEEIAKLQGEAVSDRELQKVKNQAAADMYRRLQSNFFLLIQLAAYEAHGGWREINEEPLKIQAVTAADIQRVARQYFKKEGSAVATYVRKEAAPSTDGAAPAAEDPDVLALPKEFQARAKMLAAQLKQETNADELKQGLEQMEQQASQVPPQMKPVFDFMKKKIAERIAELDTAGGKK